MPAENDLGMRQRPRCRLNLGPPSTGTDGVTRKKKNYKMAKFKNGYLRGSFRILSANFFTIRAQGLRSTYPNQLALQCETQFSFDRTGKFHTRDSGIESVIF